MDCDMELDGFDNDEDSALELVDMIEVYGPDERDEVMVLCRDATRCYTLY